jgi:putative ABC transport system substrate-binding protein
MKRRAFLTGGAAVLATANAAAAQGPETVHRVGFLAARAPQADVAASLPAALRELGYLEGRNLILEWRWGNGNVEALPALLAELVHANVAVIAALANDAVAIAKRATKIPVVMIGASHPVEMGFVDSLSRPGGHVTGFAYNPVEVAGKLVQVLKDGFPRTSKVAVIWNPALPGITLYQPEVARAAIKLGIRLQWLEMRNAADADAILEAVGHGAADALYVVNDTVVNAAQQKILAFVARTRLPAIYTTRQWIDVGGLMYYGPNAKEQWRRVAYYIDRLLKGVKPGDLPVEQSARLDLVINMKTARALGLTIAPSLLARAEEVVE